MTGSVFPWPWHRGYLCQHVGSLSGPFPLTWSRVYTAPHTGDTQKEVLLHVLLYKHRVVFSLKNMLGPVL